jgi:hypothetical protein
MTLCGAEVNVIFEVERKILALILSALFLNTVGCSKGSDSAKIVSKKTFRDTSCDFAFTDGDPSVSTASLKTNNVASYFGKVFDQAKLDAVMSSSAKATAEYINTLGAKVVTSTEGNGGACNNLSGIPDAPSDVQSYWNSAVDGLEEGQRLLGLYLPLNANSVGSAKSNAFVMLTKDGDRWTLVHEMMHHLFKSQLKSQGEISSFEASQDFGQKVSKYTSLVDSNASGEPVIQAAFDVFSSYDQLAVRTRLEEATIESILAARFQAREFRFVPDATDSGSGYIRLSLNAARSDYDKIGKSVLEKAAEEISNLSDQNIKSSYQIRLNQIRAQYSQRLIEMDGIENRFGDESQSQLALLADESLKASAQKTRMQENTNHHGCSHEVDSEAITKIIGQLKK